ncbi:MAG: SpoIIE family protein phosphatase [Bacteroidales bacterium]
MKKFVLFIILLGCATFSFSQLNRDGSPFIKHYSSQITSGSDQNWWITRDKFGALYLANDDRGVIRYDGTTWSSIPIRNNSRVRALDTDKNGIVYVGGAFEFGFIEPDGNGKLTYQSLSKRYDKSVTDTTVSSNQRTTPAAQDVYIGEIVSLVVSDSLVYYLSDESLFIYNINTQELENVNPTGFGYKHMTRIFRIDGHIFLADNSKGICEIKDNKLIELPKGDAFSNKRNCLTVLPASPGKLLVATYRSGLILYDYVTGEMNENWADPVVNSRVRGVYCGARLSTGEYIIGTINGDGIYVIDADGKLTGIWNIPSGVLKDDLIYALYADSESNELWVATYGYVSRLYTDMPYNVFTEANGLTGAVNGIESLNDVVYVTTDRGVFKSYENEAGARLFKGVDEIGEQSFPIVKASVDGESFLLTSSIYGLFQIGKDGKITDINEIAKKNDPKLKIGFAGRFILQSLSDPHTFYLGSGGDGIHILNYKNHTWRYVKTVHNIEGLITYMVLDKEGGVFAVTDYPNAIYRVGENDTLVQKYLPGKAFPATGVSSISIINGDVVISTSNGLFKYVKSSDAWVGCNEIIGGYSAMKEVDMIFEDSDGDYWIEINEHGQYKTILVEKKDTSLVIRSDPYMTLPNVKVLLPGSIDGKSWIGKSKNIYISDKKKLDHVKSKPSPMFTRIVVGGDSLIMNGTFSKLLENGRRIPVLTNEGMKVPEIKYTLNSISFYWTTPSFNAEERTLYSYKIEGLGQDWSQWENIGYKEFTNLPFGHYKFHLRAKTSTGIESESQAIFSFVILKPWYLTTIMIFIYLVAAIFAVFGITVAYTRKLKNENLRLEGIVAERTAEVVKQKDELESSIHYARRIQMALLPGETVLADNLKNYFILFRPRDIVSGDFYWMTKKSNRLYIVAADCTGHGVPGAFMSLLGMSFLDEIIDKETAPRADHILDELRLHVTESLKQSGVDNEAKDGMDMSLLVVDYNSSRVEFSGAYNPCFRVRELTSAEKSDSQKLKDSLSEGSLTNGKYILETIYASRMPIGISSKMDEKFVFYDWQLERGVSYYLFSDGYIDQFGGPKGKKFMKNNFKKLILDIQEQPMWKQKELLEKSLNEWMGQSPQIDDILVMGIRTD